MGSPLSNATHEVFKQLNTVVREARSIRRPYLPRITVLDFYTQKLEDFGFSIRWGYRITKDGVSNSRPNMGPNADGQLAEIEIMDAVLIGQKEIDLPLAMFTANQLADVRDEIEADLT